MASSGHLNWTIIRSVQRVHFTNLTNHARRSLGAWRRSYTFGVGDETHGIRRQAAESDVDNELTPSEGWHIDNSTDCVVVDVKQLCSVMHERNEITKCKSFKSLPRTDESLSCERCRKETTNSETVVRDKCRWLNSTANWLTIATSHYEIKRVTVGVSRRSSNCSSEIKRLEDLRQPLCMSIIKVVDVDVEVGIYSNDPKQSDQLIKERFRRRLTSGSVWMTTRRLQMMSLIAVDNR